MKTIKILFISTLMLFTLTAVMAQDNEVPAEIITALQKGDAARLNNFLNVNVELVIGSKNDVFSKPQASVIISEFFKINKVSTFEVLHKGNKETASFLIGTLKTSNATFRVYILTRKAEKQTIIQQLRIEPLSND